MSTDSFVYKEYIERGKAYLNQKKYDLAIEEFKKALELVTRDEEIYIDLGIAYREKGRYDLAIEEFKKAREINPKSAKIFAELGRLHEYKGEYELAIQEFEEAIAKGYQECNTYKDLGIAYYNQKDYDAAIQHLRKALSLGLNDINIYLILGKAYRENEEYEQSAEALKEGLKFIKPEEEPFFSNKILNEIEISQKKTVLESKPTGLWITLTTHCNLRCIMCEVWKKSWDLPENTIEEVIEYLPYLEKLYWQGGEVFLSEYFDELFEKASSFPYLRQNINTNGLLIDEKWAKKLSDKKISITFAIDGITKNTYEKIRRGARFEDLIQSIESLNKYKVRDEDNPSVNYRERMTTIMRFIVMRSNYHELESTVEFAKKYNFDFLQIFPIDGTFDIENIFIHQDKKIFEHIDRAKNIVYKKAKEYVIDLVLRIPEYIIEKDIAHNKMIQEDRSSQECIPNSESDICPEIGKGFCYLPWQHLFIDSSNRVRPSCECLVDIGNLNDSSLKKIWNSDKMQFYRKSLLEKDHPRLCMRVSRKSDFQFEKIKTYYADKKYPKVLSELLNLLRDNPNHAEAKILLARTYMQQCDYVSAVQYFKEALSESDENSEIHYELGICYRQLKKFELAIQEFRKAEEFNISVNPAGFNEPQICLELGRTYRDIGDYDSSLTEFNKLLAKEEDIPEIHFELGKTYRMKGEYKLSMEKLKNLISCGYDNADVRLEIIRNYRESGDYDSSFKEIQGLIRDGFDNPEAHLELSRVYHNMGEHRLSLTELKNLIASGFDKPEVRLELAKTHRYIGEYNLSLSELQNLIACGYEKLKVSLEIARTYQDIKEYQLSLTELKNLIASGFDKPEVRLELARTYRFIGEYNLSLIGLQNLISSGFDKPEVRLELARTYRNMGNYDLSLEELNRLISRGIDNPEIRLELEKTSNIRH